MTPSLARVSPRFDSSAVPAADVLDRLDDAGLDQLPGAALALDADGRVARCNVAAARFAGVARWQVLGRAFDRELGWLLGGAAAETVRAFRAGCAVADSLAAVRTTRGRATEHRLRLARGERGTTWLLWE